MKQHPTRLGKYPITGVLGEGAMGVVYKAMDPVIGRTVAIKTIHKQLAVSDDDSAASYAERFRNEAQAVGRLSHPGIVAIYEYGEDADVAFIAMEYVQGRTLSQLLASTPLPNEATIVRVMEQLLDALDCAHRAGVWHRDIKPANIIVTETGQLKLTDFGIARIETNALTLVTSIIDTPGYIAPEQYIGLPLDHRIDVFAAGVLLYRMLTGNSPFAGTPEAVMFKTVNEHPVPPSRVGGAKRSAVFDAVVAKALAKSPEDRYASAAAFRQALSAAGSASKSANVPGMPDAMTRTTIEARADLPDEDTVVPSSTSMSRPPEPSQPGLQSGGTLLKATTIAGWDVSALAPVELALASFLGPMAKLLVRKAARTCTDMPTLVARVATEIADPKERAQFVKRVSSVLARHRPPAASPTTPPTSSSQPGTPLPITDPGGPLSTAVISHALRVLTGHMGPIARIVVKRAAAQARNTPEFYRLLAEEAAESVDRRLLMKQLMTLAG